MKTRVMLLSIGMFLVAALGLVIAAWQSRPKLIEIEPAGGATDMAVTSSIRLVFSTAMKEETVSKRLSFTPDMKGELSWDKNTLTFIPESPWPQGKEITVQLRPGAQADRKLALAMRGQEWTFTTSQATLAYLWPANDRADIYSMNPMTGKVNQITGGMGVLDFTVDQKGTMIYFSAADAGGGSGLYQIDRMDTAAMDGETYTPKKLLDCRPARCGSIAVSYDDSFLAYESVLPVEQGGTGLAQVWLLSLPDLVIRAAGQANHESVQPAWSSSGWLAFYDRTSSTYKLLNPATQENIQLANQTGQPGDWSPDGMEYLAPEIYYIPAPGSAEKGTSHLLGYSIASGKSVDLSGSDSVEDVEGTYSPDGGLIAFMRKYLDAQDWSFGRQIWVMNQDGTNAHPITAEMDFTHYDLSWSLDGQMIAYVRFNQVKLSESPEVWIINADGSSPKLLIIGGYSPIWIP